MGFRASLSGLSTVNQCSNLKFVTLCVVVYGSSGTTPAEDAFFGISMLSCILSVTPSVEIGRKENMTASS